MPASLTPFAEQGCAPPPFAAKRRSRSESVLGQKAAHGSVLHSKSRPSHAGGLHVDFEEPTWSISLDVPGRGTAGPRHGSGADHGPAEEVEEELEEDSAEEAGERHPEALPEEEEDDAATDDDDDEDADEVDARSFVGTPSGAGSRGSSVGRHWAARGSLIAAGQEVVGHPRRSTLHQRVRASQSAPMLPACPSPFGPAPERTPGKPEGSVTSVYGNSHAFSTWYTWKSRHEPPCNQSTIWKPLGGTWRERSLDENGPVRANVDDGSVFINGCVPQWGRGGCRRTFAQLEHELTWSYYHLRRHIDHPLRLEVGETLSVDAVPPPMRLSKAAAFRFWSDLRPPFQVLKVQRSAEEEANRHTDGDLFEVTYRCPIDYCSERSYICPIGSTFDNTVRGVALLRIPDHYPQKRPVIVSWGKPVLGCSSALIADTGDGDGVNPELWMPIAKELNLRVDHPRLKACMEVSKRLKNKHEIHVAPLQRLLLGPKASLPLMVAAEMAERAEIERRLSTRLRHERYTAKGIRAAQEETVASQPKELRKREHRIFTAAGGFVRYAG